MAGDLESLAPPASHEVAPGTGETASSGPVSQQAYIATAGRDHDGEATREATLDSGLRGLDVVPSSVSPKDNPEAESKRGDKGKSDGSRKISQEREEEIELYEKLEAKVRELQDKIEKAPVDRTPMVSNPDAPSQEERDRHELTHAEYRSWCPHCVSGLGRRDKHSKSASRKRYGSRLYGEIDVPDTEAPVEGISKFS